jgi:hypothetical protein
VIIQLYGWLMHQYLCPTKASRKPRWNFRPEKEAYCCDVESMIVRCAAGDKQSVVVSANCKPQSGQRQNHILIRHIDELMGGLELETGAAHQWRLCTGVGACKVSTLDRPTHAGCWQ